MNLEILKIASNTKNFRDIKKYTHFSKSKNPLCGDEIQIKLVINNQKIIDFGYQGKSCIYCQATASILSNKLINYETIKIKDLCDYAEVYFRENQNNLKKEWKFLRKLLNPKNLSRQKCILLPFNALKKIVSTS
tara:strand:+ start:267 stop:668 length:402 start_codon:yes stop_codon:yes gene_type:complete